MNLRVPVVVGDEYVKSGSANNPVLLLVALMRSGWLSLKPAVMPVSERVCSEASSRIEMSAIESKFGRLFTATRIVNDFS